MPYVVSEFPTSVPSRKILAELSVSMKALNRDTADDELSSVIFGQLAIKSLLNGSCVKGVDTTYQNSPSWRNERSKGFLAPFRWKNLSCTQD